MTGNRTRTNCVLCDALIDRDDYRPTRYYCKPCSPKAEQIRNRAMRAVYRAIYRGELAPPVAFSCEDCGSPAVCYDHRNYLEPLVVAAVCHGCNLRRGPGKYVIQEARA